MGLTAGSTEASKFLSPWLRDIRLYDDPDKEVDAKLLAANRKLEEELTKEYGRKARAVGTVYIKDIKPGEEETTDSVYGRIYPTEEAAMADLPRLSKEFGEEVTFNFDHFIDPDTLIDTPGLKSQFIIGTSFKNVGTTVHFPDVQS